MLNRKIWSAFLLFSASGVMVTQRLTWYLGLVYAHNIQILVTYGQVILIVQYGQRAKVTRLSSFSLLFQPASTFTASNTFGIAFSHLKWKYKSLFLWKQFENTQRQCVGHIAQFRIMNPHQWPLMNWQWTSEEFTGSISMTVYFESVVKNKILSMVLDIKLTFEISEYSHLSQRT